MPLVLAVVLLGFAEGGIEQGCRQCPAPPQWGAGWRWQGTGRGQVDERLRGGSGQYSQNVLDAMRRRKWGRQFGRAENELQSESIDSAGTVNAHHHVLGKRRSAFPLPYIILPCALFPLFLPSECWLSRAEFEGREVAKPEDEEQQPLKAKIRGMWDQEMADETMLEELEVFEKTNMGKGDEDWQQADEVVPHLQAIKALEEQQTKLNSLDTPTPQIPGLSDPCGTQRARDDRKPLQQCTWSPNS